MMRLATPPARPGAMGTAALAAAALVALAIPAKAQDLGGGRIQIELQLYDEDGDPRRVHEESEDIRRFFNMANCRCDEPFVAELTLVGAGESVPSEAVHVYVGQECERFDDPRHGERCQRVRTIEDVRDLRSATRVEIGAGELMFPNSDTCGEQEATRWIYVMIEDPDQADPQPVEDLGLFFDTQPPPRVRDPQLAPGENAAQLDWEIPSVRADDLYRYQVLCARSDGEDGPEDFGAEPRYATAADVCGADVEFSPEPTGARAGEPLPLRDVGPAQDGPDAATGEPDASGEPDAAPGEDDEALPDDIPDELRELDSAAICGAASGATRTSLRVDGLENDVPYHILLVGIDRAENPHPMYFGEVEPRPAIDFWDEYQGSGGTAEGGYCFVATAAFGGYDHTAVRELRTFRDDTLAETIAGRAFIAAYYRHGSHLAAAIEDRPLARAGAGALLTPVVALAALWNAAGPAGVAAAALALVFAIRAARRRSSRRPGPGARAAPAAAAALVFLSLAGPAPEAEAQRVPSDFREAADEPGPPDLRWNTELKVGGYFPAMDRDFDGTGPFESVFGSGPFLLGKVTVDHFFFYPAGQLGITGSAGYFSESARAFATDDDGDILRDDDGEPIRSEGDRTSFRMIPASLGVVYRYTQLDDALGVPIVPYGRLGAAYYLWWATQPDGSIAETEDNRARGGSFGWEGSAGIALRAERLDPSAARNLRNQFGIEHASFFAEVSYARVDSLGRDARLPVGGFAFLGGLGFEF